MRRRRFMELTGIAFCAVLALGFGPTAAMAVESTKESNTLDHLLLWGRDIDQVTSIMGTKLGFQVRPGRNPDGVANRYVRMADGSYVELLGITRPNPVMDPGMLADQASLRGGPGARNFGLLSSALDKRRSYLLDHGFETTDVFSASPTDPDGAGPSKPRRWRLFAFERQPLSSGLFFIDYPVGGTAPTSGDDDKIAREHAVGAQALTAVWLLSSSADADRKQLLKMGFADGGPVRIPQITAVGYCVAVGDKHIFTIQPNGPGVAADALRSGGPQVLGISIGVSDFGRAKRRVERGYEKELASYQGLLGESFLAPTQEDLGLFIEFHSLASGAGSAGCAAP
jgi:hypothetical protein